MHFIAGDPLRAVAALSIVVYHLALVVAFHLGEAADFGEPAESVLEICGQGIYVFFVLSGYLLSRPFVASFHLGRRLPAVGPYLRNRLLRIVPAFWAVSLLALLYFGTRGSEEWEVVAVFGFAQTYFESPFSDLMVQAWTLGAELLFYCLLPIGAFALVMTVGRSPAGRGRLLLTASVIGIIAAVAFYARAFGGERLSGRPNPPAMLYAFAPGVALAAIEVLRGRGLAGRVWGPAVSVGCVVGGVLLLAIFAGLEDSQIGERTLLATVGSCLLVAGPLVRQWTTGSASRALDNRFLNWAGQRSYAIYLVHFPVIVAVDDVLDGAGDAWSALAVISAAAVPLTLVLSEILHRTVERPFLGLRSRWQRAGSR